MAHAEAIGDVVYFGVERKKAALGPWFGPGALLDQVVHFGDGVQSLGQLLGKTQRPGQAGRRIGVDGQHVVPGVGIDLGQQGRQRRLSHTPLAANSDLHKSSPRSCVSHRPIIPYHSDSRFGI